MDKKTLKEQREGEEPPKVFRNFSMQNDFEKLWKSGAACENCSNHTRNCYDLPNPCLSWREY